MALGHKAITLLSLLLVIRITTSVWRDIHNRPGSLTKRSLDALDLGNECENVQFHQDQCAFVIAHCHDVTPGLVDYIRWYYCASRSIQPFILVLLCLWLLFLFGFVGPNLQTIASALHLSESLTGVTFLAFGNGSPDLFSTFSAMNSNMGSLALGELVGAAAFIVSVVAGSMCAIKPFRTKRFSFIRDVSFFTLAVILIMSIVADGLIHLYESIILIVFYIIYVFVVVGGNYYMKRRSNYLNLVQRARLEYEENGPEVDNLLRGNGWYDDEMELYDEGFETEGYHSDNFRRQGVVHPKLRIRTSLFSAIEFQDVVKSLQHSNARFADGVIPIHQRRHPRLVSNQSDIAGDTQALPLSTPGESDSLSMAPISSEMTRQRLRFASFLDKYDIDVQDILARLFPSVMNFSQKSVYSKISSVISTPVIFMLTITLPVVKENAIIPRDGVRLDDDALTMLRELSDNATGADPVEITELAQSTSGWSQWITAVQLLCAPMFAATVFAINGFVRPAIILPTAAIFGVVITTAFTLTTSSIRQPRLYWMMSFVGFGVAMLWIFVIANEVVSVLQTIGMALGISDAILGLTVFALGNSLGDLVANVTMAKMGYPMMAMSACFGGPMLNILLGVGIGATYVTSERNEPYPIELSKTILVTAIGLVIVLVFLLILVPLNNYRMSRVFGIASISVYLICTGINLFIEISGP
ncbi:Sodium/calcium exchanger protein-domain-containing protein [Dichotomocladium elegans]|nr:Sodium/calcium exchanger protein-domain-containing protein [Dichotomocladium elegans]